jgi:acyl-CoA synthetase (AMP-forming)/AMP-acid ligase II
VTYSPAGMTWPYLRAMRWSDAEAARYYACAIWERRGVDAMLAEHARNTPDKLAIHDGSAAVTFAELDARTRGLAAGLRERGVGTGSVVAVRMGNRVDHAVVVYALAAAGAVLFELPPDATPVQAEAALRRTSAVALIADAAPTATEAAALTGPALATSAPEELAAAPATDLPGQDPDAVSLLIGTSGTTGTPKIAMRTTNASTAMSRSVTSRTGVGRDSVAMVAAPLSGGVGYVNGLCTLAVTGCSLILTGDFRPGALLREIERHRVTHLATLPTLLIRMLGADEAATADVSSLRTIQSGGAHLDPDVAALHEARFGCRVVSAYGAMDLGVPAMVATHGDTAEHRHRTVGRGFPGTEHRIVDDDGAPLPDGEIGEVVMRGPTTALGYHADEEATRVLFDERGWGHFGDLGLIDTDGYLRIVGRVKEVINRGGKKISINEVEDHVRAFPGVVDVAAVGYDDPELGERCAVVVVTEDGAELTLDALRGFLSARGAPKHTWPERIEHFDELPVSPQGKVRRRELRELIG